MRTVAELYTSGVSSSAVPIGPYERREARVRPWDPRVLDVAAEVSAIVHGVRPDLTIEHIGSTAVAGLPGKGIVDLATEVDLAEVAALTEALHGLGFGPQPGPNPWPPTRPMLVGSIHHDGEEYRIHFHVLPRESDDLSKDLWFRDLLRTDPAIRDGYARVKSEIAGPGGGPVDAVRYQAEKGEWIVAVFDRRGVPRPFDVQGGLAGNTGSAGTEGELP
jgi:GrpB-like predicted nucleotidyltransferase (UPF0157 family)